MSDSLKSLSKGLQVYKEIINFGKPIQAKVLCDRLDINKSTMSRILQTLVDEEYIEYLDFSNEIISKSLENEENKKTKAQLLIQKTKPLLEEISKLTNECAYLGIFDNYKVLYLNQVDKTSRKLKTRNNIGLQAPLHTSALGKSILAFGNYSLEKLILNQYTHNTIKNLEQLNKILNDVQKNGYSIDYNEFQDNMCCTAVPLFNHENILIGAVGISGTKKRLPLERLNQVGKEISSLVEKYNIMC